MTQLERLRVRLPDAASESDAVLEDLLESAQSAILARRYPFAQELPDELPSRYADLQVRIAVVMYSQRGAEGETSHSESGVSRQWAGLDSLLAEVVPLAKVLGRG